MLYCMHWHRRGETLDGKVRKGGWWLSGAGLGLLTIRTVARAEEALAAVLRGDVRRFVCPRKTAP